MKCIKCGVEIPTDQVFCADCLEDMQKHPVKPDTPLILPVQRTQQSVKRSSRKKTVKPEERINRLRKTVIYLLVITMVLAVLLTVSIMMLLEMSGKADIPFLPGQNYGTLPAGVTDILP